MTRKSPARRRPAPALLPPALARKHQVAETVPSGAGVLLNTPAPTSDGFTTSLENVIQEILAVTYWFDPAPDTEPSPVTIRFSGRRVGVQGKLQPGDQFIRDETIKQVIPGSGPISITAKLRGLPPGEWAVTASVLESAAPARGRLGLRKQGDVLSTSNRRGLAVRLWRRWAPSVESVKSVNTCLIPFARVPGILIGIWGVMVTLGMVVALALQLLVLSTDHLAVGSAWVITLIAIGGGIVGAKGWFIVLHWRAHGLDRISGWCIQGFISGATLAAAILLVVLHVSAGMFLDAAAPGLLVAMAVGRVGCFFAGCCGGPPTASGFGVWSSDQRVGARRVPTQLLESLLALSLGLGVLVAVLSHGPAGGAFFMEALAVYTLGRQGILRLRAEPRKTRWAGLVTVALAALVLAAAVVWLAR